MNGNIVTTSRWYGAASPRWGRVAASGLGAARPTGLAVLAVVSFFVLPVALIPSERGDFVRLPWLPTLWWTTWWLFAFAIVVGLYRATGGFSRPVPRPTKRWFWAPILFLGLWQVVSMLWNGRDQLARSYSLFESLAMCSAVTAAVCVASGLHPRARLRFGSGLTLLVAGVAAIYMSLSFFFPSLRPSDAWMERTSLTLGFVRVFGPLGTATTLNFMLIPALGFALGRVFESGLGRVFWGLTAAFLCAAVISTGSRGGLLCLGALFLLLMLAMRIRAAMVVLPAVLLFVGVVAFVGLPERLRNLEDQARVQTYRTGLRAYSDNLQHVVLGTGHGALYSKLHDDSLRKLHGKSRWYLLEGQTQYGYSLRNSHSAMVRSLVETGPLGLLLQLLPLGWISYRLISSRYYRPAAAGNLLARSTLAGCAAVILFMGAEEFLISAFWPVVLWSLFVVIGAEAAADSCRAAGSARRRSWTRAATAL